MHRKSQSTSALSLILSGNDAASSSRPPPNRFLPSLSEGETVDSPITPSRRTQGSRISHSRTRSDLGSLVATPRLESRTPVASRRLPEGLPGPSRKPTLESSQHVERQQYILRRGTRSGAEDDTSDNSDLGTRRPPRILPTEAEGSSSRRTPRKTSKEDVRAGPSRPTPRKDAATLRRSRAEDGFDDLSLERCPSMVSRCRFLPRLLAF